MACNNYNEFIRKLEKDIKKAGLKWTKKCQNFIRKFFTEIDEQAEPVIDINGEIKPYVDDAYINEDSVIIGYELSFTKYFHKPVQLRNAADIIADIKAIEQSTDGLFSSIIGG